MSRIGRKGRGPSRGVLYERKGSAYWEMPHLSQGSTVGVWQFAGCNTGLPWQLW